MLPPEAGTEPVVRVRGLQMSYGPHDVLTGVDIDVHAGEVVCLLGPERCRQDDDDRDSRGLPAALRW